ncbi:MAG: phytoene desaturase [Gammaproteobacteria bacterium]|nr:phytoene desaturase [Gammaproteobacteria bacterium]
MSQPASRKEPKPRAGPRSSPRVLIIGAGIGGLTAAVELARSGAQVTVLESADGPGGKLRPAAVGGTLVDTGPTVLTLRDVFDGLFEDAGERLDDHLQLESAALLARHAWLDGSRLDLHADPLATEQAIGDFAGLAEARRFAAFRSRAKSIHDTLEHTYMRAKRPSLPGLIGRAGIRGLPGLLGISPFTTLWQELGRTFQDPRLQQLFGRYATYCGSSPFLAPATLMLIAHVELAGVWRVMGGMHRLATAVEKLGERCGATYRYHSEVVGLNLDHRRVSGVELASGEVLTADAVVFNGDQAALAGGLLGEGVSRATAPNPASERSLSAVTQVGFGRARGFELTHHNVFFSADYEQEFDTLFRQRRVPDAPTVYLCAQDRAATADAKAPETEERLFCLINAPADGNHHAETSRCQTFDHLARFGLELQGSTESWLTRRPTDWERLFPATGGALYGQATHGWQASFRRPGSRSRVPGLYLAGGSVHPGAGLPMAALSGRQAAASIRKDLGLPEM